MTPPRIPGTAQSTALSEPVQAGEAPEAQPVSGDTASPETGEVDAAPEDSASRSRLGRAGSLYPRASLEGGLSWTDLSNGAGLDHFGGYGRLEGGLEYRISDDVFIQANAGGSLGSLSQDLGSGVSSSHGYESLFFNARGGIGFFDNNLRIHAGLDLGAAHVSASDCEDGLSCGAVFTRNPQLMGIDSWSFMVAPEVGISTLQGGLNLFARVGWMSGVNPEFNAVDSDGSTPNFGLNIPYVQLGVSAELFSLIRFFTGEGQEAGEETESDAAGESEGGEAEGADGDAPAAEQVEAPSAETPQTLQGLDLIRDRQEELAQRLNGIIQASALVTTARAAYRAVAGDTADANRQRRIQVLEALSQARQAVSSYEGIATLIEESRTAQRGISEAGPRREAISILQEMGRRQTEARTAASRVYREVQGLVEEFNNSDPGEDVTIDFADPQSQRQRRPLSPEQREAAARRQRERQEARRRRAEPSEGGEGGGEAPQFRFPTDDPPQSGQGSTPRAQGEADE